MNEHYRPGQLPGATQAAEGLPRRRWSVAEDPGDGGQGHPPGGRALRADRRGGGADVAQGCAPRAGEEGAAAALGPLDRGESGSTCITETTLYVSKDEFYEPDFLFWPRSIAIKDITAATALLIVEVADTSIGYDLGVKASTYARLGLPEYWVINARTLVTSIHRNARACRLPRTA